MSQWGNKGKGRGCALKQRMNLPYHSNRKGWCKLLHNDRENRLKGITHLIRVYKWCFIKVRKSHSLLE